MLVHLGQNRAVHDQQIIALIDLSVPLASDTQDLIRNLREQGRTETLGEHPKTLVLAMQNDQKPICIFTTTGLRTLRARLEGPVLSGF